MGDIYHGKHEAPGRVISWELVDRGENRFLVENVAEKYIEPNGSVFIDVYKKETLCSSPRESFYR